MAFDAIVGDYGDEITLDMGEDITGWLVLLVYIQKPDGTVLTKTNSSNGVTDKSDPTSGLVYYTVENTVRTVDGTYRYSASMISASSVKSSPIYDEDVVGRQNQTVSTE